MLHRRRWLTPYLLLLPGLIWLAVFFLVPMYYLGTTSLQTGSLGTCTEYGKEGESCDATRRPCGQGLFCGEFSVCHAAIKIGSPCAASGSCESAGFCAYGKDGGTCVAPKSSSRPAVVCAALVRETGAVRSFTVDGQALAAEQLEKCNARAR